MKRMHVHVAVDQLDASIRFYTTLFGTPPSVVKPDYAKWMLDDPRVNFAISDRDRQPGVNHLGIQVESADELHEMQGRIAQLQAPVLEEANAACCYARSDKYWVADPAGVAWETFHTLDAIPVFGEDAMSQPRGGAADAACCIPLAAAEKGGSCCVPTGAAAGKSSCC